MSARHINELIASRRALLGGLVGMPLLNLAGCAASTSSVASAAPAADLTFAAVPPSTGDTLVIPTGYRSRTLMAWGDALFANVSADVNLRELSRHEQEHRFGTNCDMLALFPGTHSFPPQTHQNRMILCANNESATLSLMFPELTSRDQINASHISAALASTGVSVVTLERVSGEWRVVKDATPGAGLNRRITPFTPVVFSGPAANHPWIVAAGAFFNRQEAGHPYEPNPPNAVRCGTSSNCAGGQTPWGTYLTAEENFHDLFHVSDDAAPALLAARQDGAFVLECASMNTPGNGGGRGIWPVQYDMAVNPHGPTLYGWVVEIDPYDPSWAPRKRTALGRRKGECATTALTRDGRVAVYSGDDQVDEFVYKFVSRNRFNPNDRLANRDLLDEGALYVARFTEDGGEWLELSLANANAAAQASAYPHAFRDDGDVRVRAREAARLMGATPMDRPEDVEALRDENWVGIGSVLIACTNNGQQAVARPGNPRRESPDGAGRAQSNRAGHIVRIDEANGDCGATRFTWGVFALAGDPDAQALVQPMRDGRPGHVSTMIDGQPTFTGDRFACPDNFYIDSRHNVWITTDGSDGVFSDCNDCVLVTPANAPSVPHVRRFAIVPVGAEATGPCMAPDETAFFLSVQHPGAANAEGQDFGSARWRDGAAPFSHFPDGGDSWPRSAVVVITREDGGRIGA